MTQNEKAARKKKIMHAVMWVVLLILFICFVAPFILVSAMASFVIVRNQKWTACALLFAAMVASMVIPFQVLMVPLVSVYGGTQSNPAQNCDTAHILHAYVRENNSIDYKQIHFKGGAIHGGNSNSGSGGIQMNEKSRVSLYYTTVAG